MSILKIMWNDSKFYIYTTVYLALTIACGAKTLLVSLDIFGKDKVFDTCILVTCCIGCLVFISILFLARDWFISAKRRSRNFNGSR